MAFNIPYKIYEVKNISTKGGYVYMGKSPTIDDNNGPVNGNNSCFTTFLFGSLEGGDSGNIRIDPPTNKDPYTFIDVRFYDVHPYQSFLKSEKGEVISFTSEISANNILAYSVAATANGFQTVKGDMLYYFKNITNNGTSVKPADLIIDTDNGQSFIGVDGKKYFIQPDGKYSTVNYNTDITEVNDYIIKQNSYQLKNAKSVSKGTSLYSHSVTTDNNTSFFIKQFIPGTGVNISTDNDNVYLTFDTTYSKNIPCNTNNTNCYVDETPILNLPSSSSNSSSSSVDDCSIEASLIFRFNNGQKLSKHLNSHGCNGSGCHWDFDNNWYKHVIDKYDHTDPDSTAYYVKYLLNYGYYYSLKQELIGSQKKWVIRIGNYNYYYLDADLTLNLHRTVTNVLVFTSDTLASNYIFDNDLTNQWVSDLSISDPTHEYYNLNVGNLISVWENITNVEASSMYCIVNAHNINCNY